MSITDKMRKAVDACIVMAGVEPDFECVYMTKDAALLYLDEIDAENTRLRSEFESVGTAAYLYGRSDLKAENAKLREEIEAAKHDLSMFSERIVELDAENAKLRELMDELYPLADYGSMDASELDRAHDLMRELGAHDLMRELGVIE